MTRRDPHPTAGGMPLRRVSQILAVAQPEDLRDTPLNLSQPKAGPSMIHWDGSGIAPTGPSHGNNGVIGK